MTNYPTVGISHSYGQSHVNVIKAQMADEATRLANNDALTEIGARVGLDKVLLYDGRPTQDKVNCDPINPKPDSVEEAKATQKSKKTMREDRKAEETQQKVAEKKQSPEKRVGLAGFAPPGKKPVVNLVEAFIGAVYLDGGLKAASVVMENLGFT